MRVQKHHWFYCNLLLITVADIGYDLIGHRIFVLLQGKPRFGPPGPAELALASDAPFLTHPSLMAFLMSELVYFPYNIISITNI
jgi:hypothetical protein